MGKIKAKDRRRLNLIENEQAILTEEKAEEKRLKKEADKKEELFRRRVRREQEWETNI